MSRPAPEQIINRQMLSGRIGQALVKELAEHGYVIVHPDDIPIDTEQGSGGLYANYAYGLGWNNCRRRIFAAAEQEQTP